MRFTQSLSRAHSIYVYSKVSKYIHKFVSNLMSQNYFQTPQTPINQSKWCEWQQFTHFLTIGRRRRRRRQWQNRKSTNLIPNLNSKSRQPNKNFSGFFFLGYNDKWLPFAWNVYVISQRHKTNGILMIFSSSCDTNTLISFSFHFISLALLLLFWFAMLLSFFFFCILFWFAILHRKCRDILVRDSFLPIHFQFVST